MKDYFGSTSRRYWMVALLALTLLFSVSLVSMALPLQEENTIQVNSFGDQKKSNDGVCTLREAIISANQNSVSGNRHGECNAGSASQTDLILLPPGVYILERTDNGAENSSNTGDLDISSDTIVRGQPAGLQPVVITGSRITDRVFHVLSGNVALENLTIRDGSARNNGGGVFNDGATLKLLNVTLSGNHAATSGGGLAAASGSTTLSHVTIAGNTAVSGGSGLANLGGAAGLAVHSSIINGDSCSGPLTGSGANMATSSSCTTVSTIPGDPKLDPIAMTLDAQGQSWGAYFPLQANSPAINAAVNVPPNLLCPAADQIGMPRPQQFACDLGAIEREAPNLAPVAGDTAVSTPERDTAGDPALVIDLANVNGTAVAYDPEGALNYALNTIVTQPAAGSASISTTNLELTYTAPVDFNGLVTIVYQITDDIGQSDQGTVTVTVNADGFIEVTSSADNGEGSLRWAIGEANNPANPDTIIFKISADSCTPQTINLTDALPALSRSMTIDGTLLESGSCPSNHITVNGGKGGGNLFDALTITAAAEGSWVKGVTLTNFGGNGVVIEGAGLSAIGSVVQGNTITNNAGSGVVIGSPANPADGNEVLNNTIDANCGSGVLIYGFEVSESITADQIAGNDILGNTITNNGFCGTDFHYGTPDGVTIPSGQNNQIVDNDFSGNEGQPIDLAGDGTSDNDLYDPDGEANLQQNYPNLQTAIPTEPIPGLVVNNESEISGWLFSEPNKTYTIHFYSSSSCKPQNLTLLQVKAPDGSVVSGLQVGDTAAMNDPVPGDGAINFVTKSVEPLLIQNFILATATDEYNNTSEFSRCLEVNYANIVYTRAVEVSNGASLSQSLNHPGEVRWFKMNAQAFSKINVHVTQNGPADGIDFDVVGFKDIGKALADSTGTVDLNALDAQAVTDAFDSAKMNGAYINPPFVNEVNYAGAYINGAYINGAYINEALYSADLYAGAYINGAYINGAYINGAYINGAYINGAYINGAYINGAYINPAYNTGAYINGAYINGNAYTAAMISSVLTASANDGQEPEEMGMFTFNNPGTYYVRVQAKNGVFNPDIKFNVSFDIEGGVCDNITEDFGLGRFQQAVDQDYEALVLVDYDRMGLPAGSAGSTTLENALATLVDTAANPNAIHAPIIDLSLEPEVVARNGEADANWQCPYAKNLVADEIKAIIDEYRAANVDVQGNETIKDVILVGNDDHIPFYRYPDLSGLGPESQYEPPVLPGTASDASLKSDTFLSQDAYGAEIGVAMKDLALPISQVTVGRLVETPDQIANTVALYLDEPTLVPQQAFVSAYDFLTDGGQEVAAEFADAFGQQPIELINDTWTATDFKNIVNNTANDPQVAPRLFDIGYWAGHFSATQAQAADYSTVYRSKDFMTLPPNYYAGALIYSAGCHVGYNIVNEDAIPGVTPDNNLQPDWAAAMANLGATFVGGTGYQYGDDEFVQYSERLYSNFTTALRYQETMSVGDALILAKKQYLVDTPVMSGIDQKALLEATIYGLPMKRVNMPGAVLTPSAGDAPLLESNLQAIENLALPGQTPGMTTPGEVLGLRYYDLASPDYNLPVQEEVFKNVEYPISGPEFITTSYLVGPDGLSITAGAPVLPLDRFEATVVDDVNDGDNNDWVLRGVAWLGGEYVDVPGITPLVAAAATESSSVHANFTAFADYPQNLFTVNRFDALTNDGGRTIIDFTPAQHKTVQETDPQTSRRREFKNLQYRLLYIPNDFINDVDLGYNRPDLSARPDIYGVQATAVSGTSNQVKFSTHVDVDPSAGVQMVWIVYTTNEVPTTADGKYKWLPFFLQQDVQDSTLWTGTLTLENGAPENVEFVALAASGTGLVTMSNNYGLNYIVDGDRSLTQLTAGSLPTSGYVGDFVHLTAQLSLAPGQTPVSLADQPIVFRIGEDFHLGWTDANGFAEAFVPLINTPPTQPGDPGVQISIYYKGSTVLTPSTADTPGSFTVFSGLTQVSLSPAETTYSTLNPDVDMIATLKDNQGRPLAEMTVFFKITAETAVNADSPLLTKPVITDQQGQARLGEINLSSFETYKVWALFYGTNTYAPSALAGPSLLIYNNPPDCSNMVAVTKNGTKDYLWPPNGNMISMKLQGATDPDGDPLTYYFREIYQDEPLTGVTDGEISSGAYACSDATVRSDRDGSGDGRVYHFEFRVVDDKGAFCEGSISTETTARIPVAHDNSELDFIDGGPLFLSRGPSATACTPPSPLAP